MHLIYSILLALALLVTLPYWAVQALRHGKYRAGLAERLGRVPARIRNTHEGETIWVHAVSVGEVLAMVALIKQLRERFPSSRVLISTTTATGQKLARDRFGEENVFFFPLDFGFAIRRYMRVLRPSLVVIAETEFWPNFLRVAKQSGAAIAVVNARISDRSFPRYRALRALVSRVLRPFDLFLAQTQEDARRLIEIGAAPERVKVSGNLKFDIAIREAAFVAQLRGMLERAGNPKVIVAGSTLEGEEQIVVNAFKQAMERDPALLILAPRHPERFGAVAELLRSRGEKFWKRSELRGDEDLRGGVLLLDSLGELASVYSLADVAFVGGSLVPRGGHNILEPAYFGKAIIVGPYTENFRDIVEMFCREKATLVARDEQHLTSLIAGLLRDRTERDEIGQRAATLVRANSGATAHTLDELQRLAETKR